LEGGHPRTIPPKFGCNWPSGKLQVLGNNSKTVNNIKNQAWGENDQHSKIYLPCNFEVNPITHFGVISLFSSNVRQHFTKRAITPRWVIRFTSKLQGMC
jgi:hypothetical protein